MKLKPTQHYTKSHNSKTEENSDFLWQTQEMDQWTLSILANVTQMITEHWHLTSLPFESFCLSQNNAITCSWGEKLLIYILSATSSIRVPCLWKISKCQVKVWCQPKQYVTVQRHVRRTGFSVWVSGLWTARHFIPNKTVSGWNCTGCGFPPFGLYTFAGF